MLHRRVRPEEVESRRVLADSRFELIITDVYMVSVDGMELLLRIHQRGLEVPVVAISGVGFIATDDILAMARGCGVAATRPDAARTLESGDGPAQSPRSASTGSTSEARRAGR